MIIVTKIVPFVLITSFLILLTAVFGLHKPVYAQSCTVRPPLFSDTRSLGEIVDNRAPLRVGTHLVGENVDITYVASGAVQSETSVGDWSVRINGNSSSDIQLTDRTVGPRPPGAERLWGADLGSFGQKATYTLELIYTPSGAVCRTNSMTIVTTTSLDSLIIDNLDDPLRGRFTSLGQIVSRIAPLILILGGMVAFLFLIIGGFRYMTAQGDPKAISGARGTIISAIIGLALLASVFVVLTLIELIFKINVLGSLASPVYAQIDIGEAFLFKDGGAREVFPTFGRLFTSIINVIIGLAGVLFFVMLLWGGIRYITARGDEKAISDARGTLTSAVIGLLIVIASFAIITLISIATGADITIF